MSKLSFDEVKRVAVLANLPLEDQEIETISEQLSEVVGYFDELKQVDTSNVEPTSQTTRLTNIVREDEVKPLQRITVEEAVLNKDETHNNLFVVPMVLVNKDN